MKAVNGEDASPITTGGGFLPETGNKRKERLNT